MRIDQNVPSVFRCAYTETITVRIQSANTSHVVSYARDGTGGNLAPGQPLIFSAGKDPITLVMRFEFTGPSAGFYDVEVSGDRGGDVYFERLAQQPYQVSQELILQFLPGDPTIPPP